MSTSAFVRSARLGDVDRIVDIQVAAWIESYASVLPRPALTEMASAEAIQQFGDQWRAAISAPPSSRHRVLVATSERATVGFAASGPSQDPDSWPGTDGEVYALHVDPTRTREGHGSRLLNAVVDHLIDDRFRTAQAWVLEESNALSQFLHASGWRPSGARREVDMGAPVAMVRLHAQVGE